MVGITSGVAEGALVAVVTLVAVSTNPVVGDDMMVGSNGDGI